MRRQWSVVLTLLVVTSLLLSACGRTEPETTTQQIKVGVVLNGRANDKGFNENILNGARSAAEAANFEFELVETVSAGDFESNIAKVVADGANLVITAGFPMADATAKVARAHPDARFVTLDFEYLPGNGCADTVSDCYSQEGGLLNVTSLIFAEDQLGYLVGVLAACMSQTGVIGSVAGQEIPPVVRYVTGFQSGAKSVNPNIVTLNQYIPSFNDPATGKIVGLEFIRQNADVLFAAAGDTGNGALLAAHEANQMAVGTGSDKYDTYPEVKSSLLTSALKNSGVAAAQAVQDFAEGDLASGIQLIGILNDGVGLAPYRDWESKIPQTCKDKVEAAKAALKADPKITGAQ